MPRIILAVTNDLVYDQRMHRICTTLAAHGYEVTLVGRKYKSSLPVASRPYRQHRLNPIIDSTIFYYAFYNIRLFSWLLTEPVDVICAVNLDTSLACYFASLIKKCRRVYDAHVLFTEQRQIQSRPLVYKLWQAIERFVVPRFPDGYSVNRYISSELNKRYGVTYAVVKNYPFKRFTHVQPAADTFIICQGLVNRDRGYQSLIPAMKYVPAKLLICGDGNFMEGAQRLISQYRLEDKIECTGMILPEELHLITPAATVGIMLMSPGLQEFYSLYGRFFDYIMAGVPQVCLNYPEYKSFNDKYKVAVMINDSSAEAISGAILQLLTDKTLYQTLRNNCLAARKTLNWEHEEQKLVAFYTRLLASQV